MISWVISSDGGGGVVAGGQGQRSRIGGMNMKWRQNEERWGNRREESGKGVLGWWDRDTLDCSGSHLRLLHVHCFVASKYIYTVHTYTYTQYKMLIVHLVCHSWEISTHSITRQLSFRCDETLQTTVASCSERPH